MKFPKSVCAAMSLFAGVLVAASALAVTASAAKDGKALTVGFAQTGAESVWRVANTDSIRSEATKRGVELKFADGQGKQENQIRAIRSFVAQKVDYIILAPIVETGWDPVLREAKRAKIPVIIMDRKVQGDDSLFTCFIGSDFYEEGRMAADWLAKHAEGKTRIVELQGTPGSAAANERRKAFADAIAKHPEFKLLDSQSGDFRRAGGKEVMEAFLKKHGKTIEIVYSHNDDMTLGAVQAIEEAGLKPGKDILIVSVDAAKEAIQAIVDGKVNCTVECNPLFGPKIFDTIEKLQKGEKVERVSYNTDELFDSTNAAARVSTRTY